MKEKGRDRRAYSRLLFELPVLVRQGTRKKEKDKLWFLKTRDVSEAGLFLRTKTHFRKGTILTIDLYIQKKQEHIVCNAQVIWIAQKKIHPVHYPGIGLHFMHMSSAQKKRWNLFLKDKMMNYRDAVNLRDMYIKLKDMAACLVEIEERHRNFSHFKKAIDSAIHELDDVAHLIDKEIGEVRKL